MHAQQLDFLTQFAYKQALDTSAYLNNRKIKVVFEAGGREHSVTGRQAQTILWLERKLHYGVTALEMSSWALRLGAYIHCLRKEHDLNIETQYETHDGGHHARYVLHTPIKLLTVEIIGNE